MTLDPHQEAIELINSFTFSSIYFTNGKSGAELNARKCASVAVDLILSKIYSNELMRMHYQKIKEEINGLSD